MARLSRSDLLRAGAGALAGSLLVPGPADGAPGEQDLALLRLGLGVELLGVAFYRRALAARLLPEGEQEALRRALAHERRHYELLAGVLGPTAATEADFRFGFPRGTFASRVAIADQAARLETTFLGTYLGATAALEDSSLRALVAPIAACQSAHLAFWHALSGRSPVGRPLPFALDLDTASAVLEQYGAFL